MVDPVKSWAGRQARSKERRNLNDAYWRSVQKGAAWRRAAKKKQQPRETVEEYLARGGAITACPTMVLIAPDWVRPTFGKQRR